MSTVPVYVTDYGTIQINEAVGALYPDGRLDLRKTADKKLKSLQDDLDSGMRSLARVAFHLGLTEVNDLFE